MLNELVAREHEFADQIHQMIEHPYIDANVGLSNSRSRCQFEILVVVLRITRTCLWG